MKYALHLLLLFMTIPLSTVFAQTNVSLSMEHDGETRDYRIRLPPQYTGTESLPLVFNLHGNTSNAFEQELYTSFSSVADAEGFIVCHPDGMPIVGGSGNTWNVSFQGGSTADDVGFINKIIDELHSEYNVDLTRVYSTGMSNGGYMSYKLACELTDRIAAIASVTGSMVPIELTNCAPSAAIPVMQIHGTADPVVPYLGVSWSTGIEDLVDAWVEKNACMEGPFVTDIPDSNTADDSTVEHYEYTSCTNNVQVEFYKITNGGHTWPDAALDLPTAGATNRDINASQIIWDFFKQYQLGVALPVSEEIADDITIDIFPNPTRNEIFIETKETTILAYTLYNMLGQKVLENDFESSNIIPVSHLNKGTYLLKVETEDGFITEKIVKE